MITWICAVLLQSDFSVGGMSKRFGPDLPPPREKPPLIWQPPDRPCPPARNNGGMLYQVGGPPKPEAGDFSSTQAQVLYAGDGGPGVDRVLLLEMQNNCLSEKPEPPWWGGFRPEPAVFEWRKKGAAPAAPLAIARGLATWSNHAVILYGNGWVTTAGTATSQGSHPVLKLPNGKLPTALAVTPRNELALVAVVDSRKGAQLAVIALEACAPGFAHDWHQPYPMFPNQGSFSAMKLLGFVDLPLKSVSGLSATTNNAGGRLSGRDGNVAMASQLNLDDPGTREGLAKGWIGGDGYAVAISREEDKAVFVDLQPLLAGVRDAYAAKDFSRSDAWPPTFEKKPEWAPVVAAEIDVPKPSSVLARAAGGEHNRTFIGCEEGEIRSFSVGGLGTSAAPSEVKPAGTLAVGKNPCWLATKGAAGGPDCGFIVVSRGERALQWVSFGPKDGKITRELRDRRLIDPVYCEIADTHGLETQLVTVADFKGRKIINYRTSPAVFATNGGARYGCGPKGTDEFECGGVMPIPGYPLAVCGTNVN